MEMTEQEPCFDCGGDPVTEDGVIYIRVKTGEKRWGAAPICPDCWDKRRPGYKSVFVTKREE